MLKGVVVRAKPVTVEAVVAKLNNLFIEACVETVVIGQTSKREIFVFFCPNCKKQNPQILMKCMPLICY